MNGPKVLLVEDEESLGAEMESFLGREGFVIARASSVAQAKSLWDPSIELIILDWMLPDGQGIELLREQRTAGWMQPVIFLTARSELVDKVLGLEFGANDYVTKPFEPRELLARLHVQLRSRRQESGTPPEDLRRGAMILNPVNRQVSFRGTEITLTKVEFDLLELLMRDEGKVFSREELLNRVWGYERFPTTRTVDTHILQLRQKTCDECFETVRGVGYRFRQVP